MRELTRQQSRPPVSLQEGVQERSLWPLPVELEQKLLLYRSKDGSLWSLVSDHNKVNKCTGHRRTGGLAPTAALAPKHLASRYFQLKSGHAAIGTYLHQIHAKKMQHVRDVVLQGRQYIIFSMNAGNGDINETSSTGIWRWMGL